MKTPKTRIAIWICLLVATTSIAVAQEVPFNPDPVVPANARIENFVGAIANSAPAGCCKDPACCGDAERQSGAVRPRHAARAARAAGRPAGVPPKPAGWGQPPRQELKLEEGIFCAGRERARAPARPSACAWPCGRPLLIQLKRACCQLYECFT